MQTSEILKNKYSLPCGFVCMIGLLHTHTKLVVRNFVADYNLGSIKMKPNIFIKNEHCCVQQEIALARCQPIPSRRKMSYTENCATKCCYVHLPENSANISYHLIFTMHPLSFKTVFFVCNFISHDSKGKGSFNPVYFERKLTLCL